MSPLQLTLSPEAESDLAEIADYFAQAPVEVIERFFSAFKFTALQLQLHPLSGRRYITPNSRITNLRTTLISQFPNYLIFYQVASDRIRIVRIIHGARDYAPLLEQVL